MPRSPRFSFQLPLLAALASAGCASAPHAVPGGASAPVERPQTVFTDVGTANAVYNGGGTITKLPTGDLSIRVAASPDSAWRVLRMVYAALQIPVTLEDASTRRVANPDFHRTRQLGGTRLSRYVDCGAGMTGPNADSYRVYMSLASYVVPAPEGAEVRTKLIASAVDVAGSGTDRLPCGSTGVLEARINEAVRGNVTSR